MDNISQKMSFYENVGRPQLARNCQVSEQLWIPKIEVLILEKKGHSEIHQHQCRTHSRAKMPLVHENIGSRKREKADVRPGL